MESGETQVHALAEVYERADCRPPILRPSASPTKGGPRSLGQERQADPFTTPLCGSAAGQRSICSELAADGMTPDYIREKTGLLLDAYFSGTKVKWLLDHVPGARARAESGRDPVRHGGSWLIWKLTGGGPRHGLFQCVPDDAV